MLNPSDITAELPAPRDDEPENLRGDIRDELADHLQCSLRKELLSGAHGNNEKQAWQSVLKRFGNPAKIALECWLIKMKGKLRMQKFTIGLTVAILAICIAMFGLMWKTIDDNQKNNSALLDKVEKLIASNQNRPQPASLDLTNESTEWIPFKIRFVDKANKGKPVSNISVICEGHFVESTRHEQINKTTDENGVADFGKVRPGYYNLQANWKNSGVDFNLMTNEVCVKPGYIEKVFTCPQMPLPIKLSLNIPKDLHDKQLGYDIQLSGQNHSQIIVGDSPEFSERQYWLYGPSLENLIRCDAAGKLFNYDDSRLGTPNSNNGWYFSGGGGGGGGVPVQRKNPIPESYRDPKVWEKLPVNLLYASDGEEYQLQRINLFLQADTIETNTLRYQNNSGQPAFQLNEKGVHITSFKNTPSDATLRPDSKELLTFKENLNIQFTAKKENQDWTIELPDEFWDFMRKSWNDEEIIKAQQINLNTEVPPAGGVF